MPLCKSGLANLLTLGLFDLNSYVEEGISAACHQRDSKLAEIPSSTKLLIVQEH